MNAFILQIKEVLNLREALNFYGLEFNRAGFAVCPFHSEKTASFSVKGKRYKCFGCGASGDIITFVEDMFGLSLKAAVEKINLDFNLKLPTGSDATARDRFEADKRYTEIIKSRRDTQNYLNNAEKEYEKWCGIYAAAFNAVRDFADYTSTSDSKAYAAALHKLTVAEYFMGIKSFELNKLLLERD